MPFRNPNYDGYFYLLDETFIVMTLYFPLAVITSAGFFGLLKIINNKFGKIFLIILFFGLTLLLVDHPFDFYPNPCCNYINEQDLEAINWLGEHLPINAIVMISGYQMADYLMGVDGGVWIPTLTNFLVEPVPYDYDWGSGKGHDRVCKLGDTYVYLDDMPRSFQLDSFNRLGWYNLVYSKNQISIYQVIGCRSN